MAQGRGALKGDKLWRDGQVYFQGASASERKPENRHLHLLYKKNAMHKTL
jgi:hypothetical protein